MRLTISHSTTYHYDQPVPYALQQIRTRPRTGPSQQVVHWDIDITGGTPQVTFDDQFNNSVELVRLDPDVTTTTITARGEVHTVDTAGVILRKDPNTPLWLFERTTALTAPGSGTRALARQVTATDDVSRLHDLAARIRDAVAYETASSAVTSTAEDIVAAGRGVCQDHSHVFVTCARLLGYPARYVSGYLLMNDTITQEAGHAWGEAWVDGLGWVGFDIANEISPDERYVRVATGLDYLDAAPVGGVRFGRSGENLDVTVQVQQ